MKFSTWLVFGAIWIVVVYAPITHMVWGAASGVVSGLVAITPAAGFVDVSGAIILGSVGSLIGFFGVTAMKKKLGYDDSLDAFGIHFLVGLWGALATGFLALDDKDLL